MIVVIAAARQVDGGLSSVGSSGQQMASSWDEAKACWLSDGVELWRDMGVAAQLA